MTADIADITPAHKVASIARQMLSDAQDYEAVAGFYCILTKDDELKFMSCGETQKDLLWTLETLKGRMMGWIK